jgi:hypothetical protein
MQCHCIYHRRCSIVCSVALEINTDAPRRKEAEHSMLSSALRTGIHFIVYSPFSGLRQGWNPNVLCEYLQRAENIR